jgi:DNA-binding transcriptional MerR regulator
VPAVTLRAWESRHKLIVPRRTDKRYRLYSEKDILRIQEISTLLSKGVAISHVMDILDATDGDNKTNTDSFVSYKIRILTAISNFDNVTLEELYQEVVSIYGIDSVINKLILPLLHSLNHH